jgi:hypothetical protein
MSSGSAEPKGSQAPRVKLCPDSAWSDADDAAFLSSAYGLTPDPWQFTVLDGWLGRRKDGRWSAGRCGLAVPRQNGKNGVIEIRELYGMVALGEKFLHTAHEVKTARKAFQRLASFFENPNYPELVALVKEIRRTNGQEAIVLTNGGSVEFVARTRGSGRGYTVDVLVVDEAQELTDEQLEALLPTISAAPLGDPQIIFTGTPPGPGVHGEVFTRTRDAGVEGKDKRLAWDEWSVQASHDLDPTDRRLWHETNPALGGRLLLSTLEDELATMSPDGFARERLGVWPSDQKALTVVPMSAWRECAASNPPTDGDVSFSVDMSPDRSVVAISAARRWEDGRVHVECVRHESTNKGTGWAVEWLADRWKQTTAVVIDGQSPAMALLPELTSRGVKPTVTGAGDMAKGCGMFYDAVVSGQLTHFDQPTLNEALIGAKKRDIGQAGGWGWNRKRIDVDLTPLVSATLAHYGLATSTRRPGRKSKVVVVT